jgi:hypothetical protein
MVKDSQASANFPVCPLRIIANSLLMVARPCGEQRGTLPAHEERGMANVKATQSLTGRSLASDQEREDDQ